MGWAAGRAGGAGTPGRAGKVKAWRGPTNVRCTLTDGQPAALAARYPGVSIVTVMGGMAEQQQPILVLLPFLGEGVILGG